MYATNIFTSPFQNDFFWLNQGVAISTYEDHRMAMAFAPLALRISIEQNHEKDSQKVGGSGSDPMFFFFFLTLVIAAGTKA